MLQHIFNKYSIPLPGILYQHMGHSADKLSVLDNGAAAHALHNPSCDCQQIRINHRKLDPAIYIIMIQMYRCISTS